MTTVRIALASLRAPRSRRLGASGDINGRRGRSLGAIVACFPECFVHPALYRLERVIDLNSLPIDFR